MRNRAVGADGGSNACLFHPWRHVLTVCVKPTRILHVENGGPRVSSSGHALGTRPPQHAEWKFAPVPISPPVPNTPGTVPIFILPDCSPSGLPRVFREKLSQGSVDGHLVRKRVGDVGIEPHDTEPLRVAGGVLSADDALQ